MLLRSLLREIKESFGRWMAILAICALGVGFFCGLRVYKQAMLKTADKILETNNFYDYVLISTLGFDDESVKTERKAAGVKAAYGTSSFDCLTTLSGEGKESSATLKAITISDKINRITVTQGRMPKKSSECLADNDYFDISDIGKYIVITDDNNSLTKGSFRHEKYRITGLAKSPLYMNNERGSTELSDGSLQSFFYIDRSGLSKGSADTYTEIYVLLEEKAPIFSNDYENIIKTAKSDMKHVAKIATEERYKPLVKKARETARSEAIERAAEAAGLDPKNTSLIESQISDNTITVAEDTAASKVEKGKSYALDRESNIGYSSLEHNAEIVSNIARIFPFFFVLVAALVCMTTMTRMMDDHRTQIGVFKALGYSNLAILAKYLAYSGSAALIGGVIGYAAGCFIFPNVIWHAYMMIYNYSDSIAYIINWPLAICSLAVALICCMGSTIWSCSGEFSEQPAELIRPRAPAAGKRILLERVRGIWDHLNFSWTVTIRNVFRYKKRFFMMVVGIAGCTALLVAGFGIRTSIGNLGAYQFSEVIKYDFTATFDGDMDKTAQNRFLDYYGHDGDDVRFLHQNGVSLIFDGKSYNVTLVVTDGKGFNEYVDLHDADHEIDYPGAGGVVLCSKMHKHYGIDVGDEVTIRESGEEITVTVKAIADNYINNYAYINTDTYRDSFEKAPEQETAYIRVSSNDRNGAPVSRIRERSTHAEQYKECVSTQVTEDMLDRINDMMKSLDAVVLLVIISAAVLAFIVLYDLTNISITERKREIATIKVLGFYAGETSAYVFRENFLMTLVSILIGLPLGWLFLGFVISQIKVELIYFVTRITAIDYLLAAVFTLLFSGMVALFMIRKISDISMTDSLKSVE